MQDQVYNAFINNQEPEEDKYMDIFYQIKNYENAKQGQKSAMR